MMDQPTLDAFSKFVVTARESTYTQSSNLTPGEQEAYKRVQAGNLLLEQEKIPHSYAAAVLSRLMAQRTIGDASISGVVERTLHTTAINP